MENKVIVVRERVLPIAKLAKKIKPERVLAIGVSSKQKEVLVLDFEEKFFPVKKVSVASLDLFPHQFPIDSWIEDVGFNESNLIRGIIGEFNPETEAVVQEVACAMTKSRLTSAFFFYKRFFSSKSRYFLSGKGNKPMEIGSSKMENIRFVPKEESFLFSVGGEIRKISITDMESSSFKNSSEFVAKFDEPIRFLGRIYKDRLNITLKNRINTLNLEKGSIKGVSLCPESENLACLSNVHMALTVAARRRGHNKECVLYPFSF